MQFDIGRLHSRIHIICLTAPHIHSLECQETDVKNAFRLQKSYSYAEIYIMHIGANNQILKNPSPGVLFIPLLDC